MKAQKTIGIFADIILYVIMIMQMLYVFLGNIPHEILGVAFFVLMVIHIVFKRKWIKAILKRNVNRSKTVTVNNWLIILILINALILALSSMGAPSFLQRTAGKLHSMLQAKLCLA